MVSRITRPEIREVHVPQVAVIRHPCRAAFKHGDAVRAGYAAVGFPPLVDQRVELAVLEGVVELDHPAWLGASSGSSCGSTPPRTGPPQCQSAPL